MKYAEGIKHPGQRYRHKVKVTFCQMGRIHKYFPSNSLLTQPNATGREESNTVPEILDHTSVTIKPETEKQQSSVKDKLRRNSKDDYFYSGGWQEHSSW